MDILFTQTVEKLIVLGLEMMELRYGKGFDIFGEKKTYHTRAHAEDVLGFVDTLGEMVKKNKLISEREFLLLRLAAAWHDVESEKPDDPSVDMETVSADLLECEMANFEVFTSEDAEFVRKLILGTKVTYFVNGEMKQAAENGDEVQKILADADLGSMGMKFDQAKIRFTAVAKEFGLIKMWHDEGKNDEEIKLELYKWQSKFLQGRSFLSETARKMFGAELERNKEILQREIKRLSKI